MPYVTSSVYVKSFGQKYLTPATTTVGGTPSHIDIFGFGGLKCFYDTDFTVSQTYIHNTSETKSSLRAQFGQVVYLRSTNKYYQCYNTSNSVTGYPQYSQLFALTTGSPSFPSGITISSGGIFVQSGNINVVSPGTISAGAFTASYGLYGGGTSIINTLQLTNYLDEAYGGTGLDGSSAGQGYLLIGKGSGYSLALPTGTHITVTPGAGTLNFALPQSVATTAAPTFGGITLSNLTTGFVIPKADSDGALIESALIDNGTLITLGRKTSVSGNFQASGTASALNVTASSGFYSNGILDINGDSSLGNSATNTTSVFGTLSIVNAGSNSGSITCDSSGNLVIDGSGTSGVQITDGLLYLGTGANQIPICSGSYIGAAPDGTVGAITTSKKVCADYGFANGLSDAQATFQVDSSGNLQCQTLKQMSLRQYKHDVYYITSSQLANIAKLKPMTFLYNQDNPQDINDSRVRQAGFIAEQVQQVYPEVAWYKEGKLAGLQYQRLTAYLTKGIQELAEQNKLLKSRVQSLEQLVNGILQGAK